MGDAGDWGSPRDSSTGPQQPPSPIAIVGIGLRLPGGSGRCLVPASRYNVDAFHKPSKTKGSVASRYGYFLQDDIDRFDASSFSMSRAEVERLDPQQRLLLEVVWECMESGGQKDWRGGKIGCYVGVFGDDWLDMGAKDAQNAGLYRVAGTESLGVSNRISYEFDLKGPSMTIRTGCSASLVALHEACQALQSGDCSSAIVAGSNLVLTPTMTMAMTEQGVLSPEGISKSFDAGADGYARGEGINAVLIKKMEDAIRDGDPIRAVIRATATNCDGKTAGMSMPSPEAHEVMIRRAYHVAGIRDLSQTAFVECHATGTPIGDPLELRAIARVFGSHLGTYIGSIKPNIGHGEGASGLSSLIKTALALENRTIPPNIFFNKPNPKIPFKEANLRVPIEAIPWPANQLERASVNSFGIGGANAHVILESAASFGVRQTSKNALAPRPQLLLFSANNAKSLQESVQAHERYSQSNSQSLEALAYTLALRRNHLPHRAFGIRSEGGPLQMSSLTKSKCIPQLVFIFTGQGAQWAQMGKELLRDFPGFRQDFQVMQETLAKVPHPPTWQLLDELMKPDSESLLAKSEYAQPLCTAVQVGVLNILMTWGVAPEAVVGHSSGEIAAAYASGAVTQAEAISIAYYRGRGTTDVHRPGGMAAVGLGSNEISSFLQDGVVVACDNSPQSVTISGDETALDRIMQEIQIAKPHVFVRKLHVEMAYHSHHMRGIGKAYESSLDSLITARTATIPFYSSVTGNLEMEPGFLGPFYWRKNLESPVLFYSAVLSYLKSCTRDSLFIEVGPHSALGGPLRQIFKAANIAPETSYSSCLERRKDCTASILHLAGTLFQRQIPLNMDAILRKSAVVTDLPNYSWCHDGAYWSEARIVRDWRLRKFPRHELLGSRILEGNDLNPTWRNLLSLEDVSWIRDHKLNDDIVFPATGYICMAGEACRQISSTEDFTLQNVLITNALVIKESAAMEIMTTIRPSRLTDFLDSEWYDFTISSFSGVWVAHCSGQVKAGGERKIPTAIQSFHRVVSKPYEGLRSVGLNYGPNFRRLENTTVEPGSKTASAKILVPLAPIQDSYQIHPTAMDCCLQLFMTAASEGISRRLDQLFVPTKIEELYIGNTSPKSEFFARGTSTSDSTATINGNALAISQHGDVVLYLKGGTFSSINSEETGTDNIAAAEIVWKPSIDLIAADALIRPRREKNMGENWLLVEELCVVCMIEMQYHLSAASTTLPHLAKFHSWLDTRINSTAEDGHIMGHIAATAKGITSAERCVQISALRQQTMGGKAAAVATLVLRIFDNYKDLFGGAVSPLEILLPDDGLTKFYNVLESLSDYSDFFSCLGHCNSSLKILEIGAGTGGTSSRVLNSLTAPDGTRLYSRYCYTDISIGFFPAAKERFNRFSNIEFAIFDVNKDPVTQGFEEGEFDLVIAANVLHATPNLRVTLGNVHRLLAPNGRLFLQELSPSMMKSVNFIMGILPGWWLGENDNRSSEPFVSPERWDEKLREAGFSGTETIVLDDDEPYQLNQNIVSRRPLVSHPDSKKAVSILTGPQPIPKIERLEHLLISDGYQIEYCSLDQPMPANRDIISLIDLSTPLLHDTSASSFAAFQKFTSESKSRRILWLTRSSQIDCREPQSGLVLGLARTLRAETSINLTTLELDEVDDRAWKSVVSVFGKIRAKKVNTNVSVVDPDYEYILRDGVAHVGRYHAVKVLHELPAPPDPIAPKKLKIGKLGLLQTLAWEEQLPLPELEMDELDVEPQCVGLNFRDVLSSMGIIEASNGGLGLEASAVVRKVGSTVEGFAIGDRVIVFKSGCFSTRMHVSAKLCAKIPQNLSDEEAATVPTVYSTVIHSLINLGNLQRGQTVLIHSACGGVGLAAIQVCNLLGADIYVSAGNEEKVQFLQQTFSIPRSRIFNSRDSSFLPDLMRATSNRGVDLVLNSLSGDLLHASWKCVAAGGRFIELGKRDFVGHGKLAMDIFEDNRAFFGVDLNRFSPEQCQPLLEAAVQLLQEEKVKPISPTKVFASSKIEDAFRYMQKGIHIGKVLVQIPKSFDSIPITTATKQLEFCSEKTYLLVGGLGGLGRAISTWMVEHGARHFVYLSRSAGSPTDAAFITELEFQGCLVKTIAGSVVNLEDVQRAVSAAPTKIGGVLQMSMVLRDTLFSEHTFEDWKAVVDPKVKGTWNLHHALEDSPLDFFVLFSSISGIIGTRGQAAYAAANTFLDSFVSYRHGIGLVASCLDIAMVSGIGYLAENTSLHDNLQAQDYHTLREKDLIEALQLSIASNSPSEAKSVVSGISDASRLVLGLRSRKPLSDPTNRAVWKHDRRMSLYHNTSSTSITSGVSGNDGLKEFLDSATGDTSLLDAQTSTEFLSRLIGKQIYVFMMHPIEELEMSQTLSGLGVDSLVTIEIRNWWRRSLGMEVSTLEILGAGTISGLATLAVEGLKRKIGTPARKE